MHQTPACCIRNNFNYYDYPTLIFRYFITALESGVEKHYFCEITWSIRNNIVLLVNCAVCVHIYEYDYMTEEY